MVMLPAGSCPLTPPRPIWTVLLLSLRSGLRSELRLACEATNWGDAGLTASTGSHSRKPARYGGKR
jgi:hypothetical protein